MRAFVSYINPETGRDSLGTEFQWVTPEYKSLGSLHQYFLLNMTHRNKPLGYYHVQAFNDWNNRYGKPSYDYIFHKATNGTGRITKWNRITDDRTGEVSDL